MKQICDFEKCTGCTACKNVCSKNAISMLQNDEGFYYPSVNEELCINCDACIRVCPMNSFKFKNNIAPKCYAVMADDELRKDSSSGAFFPVLAEYVLDNIGYVVGAAFNDDMKLEHIIISDKQELYKLKGSKYLQSNMKDTFFKIKNLLINNYQVLFTGTPCQVAGLLNYLGKEYKNLITVDLVCHGVPSQKVFDNYLASEFTGEVVLNTNFRDKKSGWGNGYITTTTTTTTRERSLKDTDDSYLQAFFANISLRESCYNCSFTRMPRSGDFTMADFWGVPKEMNDYKGTSMVFLNNEKAIELFKYIKKRFAKIKEYDPNIAIKAQPQLNESSKKHPAREVFFECLNENTLQSSLDSTIFSKKNVGILNFHWENINFGAILTSYALNKFLNNNGWFARNINYYPSFPWIEEEGENKLFDVFRLRHLPMTRKFKYGDDLNELNEEFSTFIVGSDQVWRHEFIKNDRDAFFLSFAEVEKKIVSYAASFGVENINASDDDIEDYKRRIELFDFVGVREESGVEICSDLGIKSVQVCDPVFLLTKTEWEELADHSKCETDSNTVVFYTINEEVEKDISEFITKHNDEIKYENIKNITYGLGVEEWLAYIKNSKLLVTDSFHGSCFAIIFNKPFICINPNRKTSTRMETLFRILDVKCRLYSDFDDVNVKEVVENNIDWQIVNERINIISIEGKNFLENALNSEGKAIDDKAALMNSCKAFVYEKALKEKNRILFKYFRYKLFSKIATGRKRKAYKKKYEEYKLLYKRIKDILKSKGK